MAFICVNFVLALSNTIFYSLQLSHRVALRNCIIQVLNIAGILFLRKTVPSNLVSFQYFRKPTSIVYITNTILLIKKSIRLYV